MSHAPHLAYVLAAYAVSAAGLAWLVVTGVVRSEVWRRRAAAREAKSTEAAAREA